MKAQRVAFFVLALIIASLLFRAALTPSSSALDAGLRRDTVTHIAKIVRELSCRPQAGAEMSASILERLAAGAYDAIADPDELARQLERDLTSVSPDGHLEIEYDPGNVSRVRAMRAAISVAGSPLCSPG